MQKDFFEVKRERFHLVDKNLYILQGCCPKGYKVEAKLDQTSIPCHIEEWENNSALERFADLDSVQGEKVTVQVELPENLKEYQKLQLEYVLDSQRDNWFSCSVKSLLEKQDQIQYFIEEENVDMKAGTCKIRGWAVDTTPVIISICDENGKTIPCDVQMSNRVDVVQMYKEHKIDYKCGFFVELNGLQGKKLLVDMHSDSHHFVYEVALGTVTILANKVGRYYNKGVRYIKTHGISAFSGKVLQKVKSKKNPPVSYTKWLPKHMPTKQELERQKNETFANQPKISVVVPLYKTPEKYLVKLIESFQNQTYSNWELCFSDGSGPDSPLTDILRQYTEAEPRIKVIYEKKKLQISENTNAALGIATGDYIGFADHDDELTANALYECVRAVNANSEIDVIYTDEDKMSMDGNKFFQPHFKPDFNIDLLTTVNYICHFFVVKKSVYETVGMLDSAFDGAQDYDFVLRCIEQAKCIHHIPKILYHWRSHENSTSENPESKLYAFDAGQRAIEAHYKRCKIDASVGKGEYLGLYKTHYNLKVQPKVSIMIPNKDHIADLDRCIQSIEKKATYSNYEYIIIENNSTEEETFAYYKKLEAENPKVKVVYYKGHFNYSSINNFGAQHADGEYLWLLNNDTEIINPDCIEELVGYCTREDVGIVGSRLYFEDDTIQHAGVVIGFGGIAGHCFVQQKRGTTGYCHRIICAQDYSAVTAASMLVKKSVFDQVGGFDEELQVAFNDIDFCMKVRNIGKLVVYNPYSELYHYESKSRGQEDTPEKVRRFQREIAIFEKHWPDILRDGDPYYNPNLTLESQDFSLRRL
ncbi:MAG: glycosyltransferase family 2 protein [Lachnospiraceae bacterium]|nr:glycosyltransferase family 2 protein [Lachnospiraceae bacterium]